MRGERNTVDDSKEEGKERQEMGPGEKGAGFKESSIALPCSHSVLYI